MSTRASDAARRTVAALLVAATGVTIAGAAAPPGTVVNSRHNMSVTGPGTVKATSEVQVCVFCHTPHNANPARQLWNHTVSGSQTYGTYGSSTFDSGPSSGTFNTFPGRSAGQPSGSSRLCLSCHDGTIALGNTISKGTIALAGTAGGFIPATASLGTDLSNDHPVSFVRSASDPGTHDPVAGDAVHVDSVTGMVECVSCHDAHREDIDAVQRKFLAKSNARSAVCTACHQPAGSGWSWTSSPHSTSGKSYTATNTGGTAGLGAHTGYTTVADNGCAACHRSHTAPQAQRLLKAVNEARVCYQCHGATATVAQKNLESTFALVRSHPLETGTSTMIHDASEVTTSPTNFSGARRHVVCSDCHNPHGAANVSGPGTGLHAARTNTITAGSVLAGTPGVEPIAWPVALDRTGVISAMPTAAQAGYAVSASSPREYLICFKCHSSYAYGATPPPSPSGGTQTDAVAEFNPNNRSYHPVVGAPHLRVPATNLVAPWNGTTSASRMYCSDCHGNNTATSSSVPEGPHGSSNAYMLRFGTNVAWSTTAPTLSQSTGLCYNCHSASTIRSTNRAHSEGDHQSAPCQYCHSATPHGSFRPGLIALTKDTAPFNLGVAKLTRFRYSSTPGGYQRSSCYSTNSPCHEGHNDPTYAPITDPNTFY